MVEVGDQGGFRAEQRPDQQAHRGGRGTRGGGEWGGDGGSGQHSGGGVAEAHHRGGVPFSGCREEAEPAVSYPFAGELTAAAVRSLRGGSGASREPSG